MKLFSRAAAEAKTTVRVSVCEESSAKMASLADQGSGETLRDLASKLVVRNPHTMYVVLRVDTEGAVERLGMGAPRAFRSLPGDCSLSPSAPCLQ